MKLLIILLCILSERYLIHQQSFSRTEWFKAYFSSVTGFILSINPKANHPSLLLAMVSLPLLLAIWFLFSLFGNAFYDFFAFIFNLALFYLCLGEENSFYPLIGKNNTQEPEVQITPKEEVKAYLIRTNSHLFAVIFWFICLGPLGMVLYRLLYLCKEQPLTQAAAEPLISSLDWISSRVTLMLYLLVGNFQQGFPYYRQMFFSSPLSNEEFLGQGSLLALGNADDEKTLPLAQNLVESALMLYLVILAAFTWVAWL